MRLNKILMICVVGIASLFATATSADAQHVGIKTNALSDLALSPNLGVEIGLAPKWTLDISGQCNLWMVDNRRWKHAFVQPEARYWFCQRFAGHFIGMHAIGGAYNFGNINMPISLLGSDLRKLKDERYQGWAAGVGVAYGYAWPVHKHWNIEAEIGIGWMYTRYDSYPCAECGTKLDNNHPHNYVGPTKLAVGVEYVF